MDIDALDIKYNEDGLVPAIIQDANNGQVLMLAYMNSESLAKTIETGITHFWSRSRQELWQKGQTSGNIQKITDIYFDCDKDAVLIKVKQQGNACHTGNKSCFYRKVQGDRLESSPDSVYGNSYNTSIILQKVYDTIMDRKKHPKENSYTCYLFDKGIDKILKKVGEETAEVIIASKNNSKYEVIYEISDLIYHLLVLLVDQDISLDAIYNELAKRRNTTKD
ncbi:MAG: bifunctional phosphoribosyl-AMP cyclohydrolase/phosphoribosyl-ATP diphosphatase HisIE [Caldicoprobacterales bacterium]|jgi:phosphoribosyl-ATP pyrophosphohydrolase/phosphoribosyl-AMP cyclohydrolase|nr:bifunctional phosphoribosyl-AMP cyclohydrolase/phosphoribosyl-ATP diphosphatase HisIE [Clostridiales bacterium]